MELLTVSIAAGYLIYSINYFKLPSSFLNGVEQLFKCCKCLTFWSILIYTQDLTLAALTSLTVFLLESFIVTKL